ncbi:MAG TPA: hypothetical protein VNF07_07325 [Acidimicrobiales bacterium]|nr:hypothetical protein [Acidimicrobiales bacterium]
MDRVYRFRYGRLSFPLKVLGLGPAFTGMVVGEEYLKVRFSWAFATRIPRSAIHRVDYDYDFVGGIGVHGVRGTWLVNGAANGLVMIEIDPAARAFVMGFPVRLKKLRVSAADPAALIAALTG